MIISSVQQYYNCATDPPKALKRLLLHYSKLRTMNSHFNGYNRLFEAAVKAYPNKNKILMQDELTILWKEIKNNEKNLDIELMKLNDISKHQ